MIENAFWFIAGFTTCFLTLLWISRHYARAQPVARTEAARDESPRVFYNFSGLSEAEVAEMIRMIENPHLDA